MDVAPYIKIIRPVNLLIVFLTQMALYWFVVFKHITNTALDMPLAVLLAMCTSCIAACGYIVNDYYDSDIDSVNKPQHTWIGNHISHKQAMNYYWVLCSVGLLVSCYIAYKTNNFHLLPIYPIAQGMLYLYAKKWKLAGYIGNNVVALMTSFVALVIIVAERKALNQPEHAIPMLLVSAFGIFAYLINLMRELVKDIEDIDGDRLKQSRSLPILAGIERTKVIVYFNAFIMISGIAWFITAVDHSVWTMLFVILTIVLPLVFFMWALSWATAKKHYTAMSKMLKMVMFAGLVYLILLSQY